MINKNKYTKKTVQVAGLIPGDNNIEFFGIKETKKVFWIRNGHTLSFEFLPKWAYQLCQEKYLSDLKALNYLNKLNVSDERQVELYVYHMWGDIDATADIIEGNLQPCENFRDSKNCPSLEWNFKNITIGTEKLTKRDIIIIDLMLDDLPNKAIAPALNIEQSTLDFHIRNLYKRANVRSKTELIIKACEKHI